MDLLQRETNALLCPAVETRGVHTWFGIFDQAGNAIPLADMSGHGGMVSHACACPNRDGLPIRQGKWLFGGLAYDRFSLSLVYCTARLWPLLTEGGFDGILFASRTPHGHGAAKPVGGQLAKLLEIFDLQIPALLVVEPEIVADLTIPSQGFSNGDKMTGSPKTRAFFRQRLCATPAPQRNRRIYISRSRMPAVRSGFLYETYVERYLATEGYEIFHPQLHTLQHQIETYRSATHLIGIDGSAMHVAAAVVDPSTKVALLARRHYYPEAMAAQFQSFSGCAAVTVRAPLANYAPSDLAGSRNAWYKNKVLPDLPKIGAQLQHYGLIEQPQLWLMPPDRRRRQALENLRAAWGQDIILLDPQAEQ